VLEVFKKRPAGHSFVPPASRRIYYLPPLNVKYLPLQPCFISTKVDPQPPNLEGVASLTNHALPF